jgi:hypothetical protein
MERYLRAPEAAGGRREGNSARGQSVVRDDASGLADDKRARCAAGLVLQRPAPQPIVKRQDAGIEGVGAVSGGQRLGGRERQPLDQGGFARMVRRRR